MTVKEIESRVKKWFPAGCDDAQWESIGIAFGVSATSSGWVVSSRHLGADCQAAASTLLGTEWQGRAWLEHRHAHFLPIDMDGDGRLDHILATLR